MTTYKQFVRILPILLVLTDVSFARGETVMLGASKDATIFGASSNQGIPNTDGQDLFNRSNGAGPGLFSGGNGALAAHRGLIAFDIAGTVPAGSIITDVSMTLAIGIVAGSGGAPGLGDQTSRTISLFHVTADWGEGSTGSNSTTIGGTGQGFPANPGDATWNARHFGSTDWTTPGGDFRATPSGSLAVGSQFFSSQTWQSTPGMVADVQEWLDSPSSNFGWMLINADENARQTHRAFFTKESLDPAMRPQLSVGYIAPVPVPAAFWLFGTGLMGAASLMWRKAWVA
ncbi:DNRLRE domain-containing protein [Nitrospira lenta]|nr:DNRLRE domain-containing protein [Nitrospira lenta]